MPVLEKDEIVFVSGQIVNLRSVQYNDLCMQDRDLVCGAFNREILFCTLCQTKISHQNMCHYHKYVIMLCYLC